MINKNQFGLVLVVIFIAALVMSACQPQTIIQTVEVEKIVQQTVIVEVEKLVEQTAVVEVLPDAFTTPHPILGDLRVRQALAYCTNKIELARSSSPLLSEEDAASLVMDTFIPKSHWAYAGDENITVYEYDPERGGALLEEAGWLLQEGAEFRTREDGSVLALKFVTTNNSFRQGWAAAWEQQMAKCGVQILRLHVPSNWWYGPTTGLAARDFEVGAYAWGGQADPGGQSQWACDQVPLPENNWQGQNFSGWCNPAASAAITKATNTLIQQERVDNYLVVQQQYAQDLPGIPLFNRTETYAHAARLEGFAPQPGEEFYTYNIEEWQIPAKNTITIGVTRVPETLYTVVDTSYAARLAAGLTGFRSYTSLNYTFAPYWVTELSTLESGLAANTDVEVSAGARVLDVHGNVVELAAGTVVTDVEGNDVAFEGSPLRVKQLVVTYIANPDLKWQDGTPVSQADFELAYKVLCDRESGASPYTLCDRIQQVSFDGLSYTVTWVPGLQDPLYFLAPIGMMPAHQPVETEGPYQGMTLADVAPKDMPTLPEVAQKPYSYGPYMVTNFVPRERIEYAANPYFFKGEPKTKNIVITYLTPEEAETQLIDGKVDLLGSETLTALSEQLVVADDAGKINVIIKPGASWEHIVFNLFIR